MLIETTAAKSLKRKVIDSIKLSYFILEKYELYSNQVLIYIYHQIIIHCI